MSPTGDISGMLRASFDAIVMNDAEEVF